MSTPNLFYLRERVTVEPFQASSGRYGAATYGTPLTGLRALIRRKTRSARVPRGQETEPRAELVVHSPEYVIKEMDRITFPDGTQPIVRDVLGSLDMRGLSRVQRLVVGASRRSG